MALVRDCILNMTGYVPGEAAKDPSIIKLNANENRYPPSPKVAEAVAEAAANLHVYPESTSLALRQRAAELYGVTVEQVMATNGSDEMLRILFQSCCDPGDEAVAFNPSYTYYRTLAAMQDAKYRLIDLTEGYALPRELPIGSAKLVFLPNPNAPTGTLFPKEEIRRLLDAASDSLVVIDEAYADYALATSIPLIDEYQNLMVVRTFSKSYALAGLRIGLGFAHSGLLEQLEKVRDFYNLDRLAQAGAKAALDDQEWLHEVTGRIIATRQRTIEAVRALGLTAYDSAANFILVRCRDAAEAKRIFEQLHQRKVFIRYFQSPGLDDCLRVSIGTDADMDTFIQV